jgi:hypothetical protein
MLLVTSWLLDPGLGRNKKQSRMNGIKDWAALNSAGSALRSYAIFKNWDSLLCHYSWERSILEGRNVKVGVSDKIKTFSQIFPARVGI